MWLAIKTRLVIAIFLFIVACWSSASAQKCLSYGPTISLSGTFYSKVFAGPPNYESIRRGDRKETAIILRLAKPTCTTGDDPMGLDVSYTYIREMQLVVHNDADWAVLKHRKGKRVVVTGTLFGAHTGHHRTKVLIDVFHVRTPRLTQK